MLARKVLDHLEGNNMKIAFFYEHGQIKEIGTGHKYRSGFIARELRRRGHTTWMLEDNPSYDDADLVVIDHMFSQKNIIDEIKSKNKKVVLIDGAVEDTELVDLSISPFYNTKSQYRGINYIAIPSAWEKYRTYNKSNSVFISMGGFDANNYAEMIIKVLKEYNLNAVVAKSINHPDFSKVYSNAVMFEEEDLYTAMRECTIGIVNGGLTLFQSLHYGLPCVAVPQYAHQRNNIEYVQHCCSLAEPNEEDLKLKIKWFIDSEYFRESISKLAQHSVDGKGIQRICALIEKI